MSSIDLQEFIIETTTGWLVRDVRHSCSPFISASTCIILVIDGDLEKTIGS